MVCWWSFIPMNLSHSDLTLDGFKEHVEKYHYHRSRKKGVCWLTIQKIFGFLYLRWANQQPQRPMSVNRNLQRDLVVLIRSLSRSALVSYGHNLKVSRLTNSNKLGVSKNSGDGAWLHTDDWKLSYNLKLSTKANHVLPSKWGLPSPSSLVFTDTKCFLYWFALVSTFSTII